MRLNPKDYESSIKLLAAEIDRLRKAIGAFGGDVSIAWEDIEDRPTALSAFSNDTNFITNTVNNLTNYYDKQEINTLIGDIAVIQVLPVDELPETGKSNIIYLVPKAGGSGTNVRDEYLWTGTAFEKIGDTEIDLSGYYTSAQVDLLLDGKLGSDESATSATKLATARTIDGVSFNGTAAITHYGTCSTAAATAAKTVALTRFTLVTGAKISVKFSTTNTATSPTLNVNGTGAKAIYYNGAVISAGHLKANRILEFIYNGTQYELVGGHDTDTVITDETISAFADAGMPIT